MFNIRWLCVRIRAAQGSEEQHVDQRHQCSPTSVWTRGAGGSRRGSVQENLHHLWTWTYLREDVDTHTQRWTVTEMLNCDIMFVVSPGNISWSSKQSTTDSIQGAKCTVTQLLLNFGVNVVVDMCILSRYLCSSTRCNTFCTDFTQAHQNNTTGKYFLASNCDWSGSNFKLFAPLNSLLTFSGLIHFDLGTAHLVLSTQLSSISISKLYIDNSLWYN